MFDGHGLLRGLTKHAGSVVATALLVTYWAASGFPSRLRPGHSPLAFDEYSVLDTIGTVLGVLVAIAAIRAWWTMRHQLGHLDATQDFRFFRRAGAPRTIYSLLLAVASRDGTVDRREREVVERVLLADLPDGVLPQDLKNWSVPPDRTPPLSAASQLARLLSPAERMAVLRWCREVAAADGVTGDKETELLRELARILGG